MTGYSTQTGTVQRQNQTAGGIAHPRRQIALCGGYAAPDSMRASSRAIGDTGGRAIQSSAVLRGTPFRSDHCATVSPRRLRSAVMASASVRSGNGHDQIVTTANLVRDRGVVSVAGIARHHVECFGLAGGVVRTQNDARCGVGDGIGHVSVSVSRCVTPQYGDIRSYASGKMQPVKDCTPA